MKLVSTKKAPQAIGPYSQAVIANGMVFTSGQIALTPEGEMVEADIKKQARQVLTNVSNLLNDAGTDINKVVKTTIFLADMNDFAVVNEIYIEFFKDHKPARSTLAVKTLPRNALVEIECIALI